MKSVIVATGNRDKFREIAVALNQFSIRAKMIKVDLEEHGNSLEEIAESKAVQAFEKIKKPVLVDDTGVYFEAVKGFPGHRAKRLYQSLGFGGIVGRIRGRSRKAYFKTVLCYKDASTTKLFAGVLRGVIADTIHRGGRAELPYEKIFLIKGRSLASLPLSEKIAMSHRTQAARKFARWFVKRKVSAA
ncbi:MAG: non-canonical purine NTP pyrophosphatase [Candidatus Aenigmarchaeota archaeon]|nr:non-canonical purine NTP pyrophosphatase [Candidatus Aenigmarchaeota archaeon]